MISIIIPTYQHAPDITACLKSIFGQTYTDYEVIVVDDGSTDNTQEVLKPFLDRITLLTKQNAGGPHSGNQARNLGFNTSRGEYVLFCDADIILRPDALEKMLATLKANPQASYVYTAFRFGWKTFKFWDFDAATLRRMNYVNTCSLIRREHFPGFDETIRKFQDWDLWLTMLAQGHTGVYLPEVIFRAIPHKDGISLWVPRFFYKVPWQRFGWQVMSVEKYKDAHEVIRKKHSLSQETSEGEKEWGFFVKSLFALIGFEIISIIGFFGHVGELKLGSIFMVIGLLVTAFLAWRKLSTAMLIVLADLFIGSQGGAMLSIDLGGLALSWRMGLFLVVGVVFAAKTMLALIQRDASALSWFSVLQKKGILLPYLALLTVVFYATVRGILQGYGFGAVFFDMNSYLYLLLLAPLAAAFLSDVDMQRKTRALLFAGIVDSSLKALLVLYVFSHRLGGIMVPLYAWVRDTRVGEITRMLETDFYRVFFQSQLFPAMLALGVLLWLAGVATRKESGIRRTLGLLTVMMAVILLGLSRSFWVGIALAILIGAVLLVSIRPPWKLWRRSIGFGAAALGLGMVLIVGVYALPIPTRTGEFSLAGLLGSRATTFAGEAAANSRWMLLPELWKAGFEHPIFGSGFGRAVTYVTSDPRILSFIPDGVYSTVAFEWGYHDLWIKMGLFGLIAYAWFLIAILRHYTEIIWRKPAPLQKKTPEEQRATIESLGIILAVVVLLGTHIFSPYLNHPLGIGFILLIAVWSLQKENRLF